MRQKLGELKPGDAGRIVKVDGPATEIVSRLLEMGLLEGSWVELVHQGPFGGDPIAVRARGTLIALRRKEANFVWLEVGSEALG